VESSPARQLDQQGCCPVEGIGSHGERKEIGVIILEVLHVGQPFMNEVTIGPLDIPCHVGSVRTGQIGNILAGCQFLRHVEHLAKKLGELLVLQNHRILQKPYKEISFAHQENT